MGWVFLVTNGKLRFNDELGEDTGSSDPASLLLIDFFFFFFLALIHSKHFYSHNSGLVRRISRSLQRQGKALK